MKKTPLRHQYEVHLVRRYTSRFHKGFVLAGSSRLAAVEIARSMKMKAIIHKRDVKVPRDLRRLGLRTHKHLNINALNCVLTVRKTGHPAYDIYILRR